MRSLSIDSAVRIAAGWSALLAIACARPVTPAEQAEEAVPARVEIALTPAAETFVVGTYGLVSARVVDQAGAEMVWGAPRRVEASDTAVLNVETNGTVLARRVGISWLRVTWAGRELVRDSLMVRVGIRGVGTVRFFSFEGGCWVIETDPQTAYLPSSLPNAYKSDGLRVHFAARPSEHGDLCLVGPMVDLDSIRVEAP
jgi:hypothetical protein